MESLHIASYNKVLELGYSTSVATEIGTKMLSYTRNRDIALNTSSEMVLDTLISKFRFTKPDKDNAAKKVIVNEKGKEKKTRGNRGGRGRGRGNRAKKNKETKMISDDIFGKLEFESNFATEEYVNEKVDLFRSNFKTFREKQLMPVLETLKNENKALKDENQLLKVRVDTQDEIIRELLGNVLTIEAKLYDMSKKWSVHKKETKKYLKKYELRNKDNEVKSFHDLLAEGSNESVMLEAFLRECKIDRSVSILHFGDSDFSEYVPVQCHNDEDGTFDVIIFEDYLKYADDYIYLINRYCKETTLVVLTGPFSNGKRKKVNRDEFDFWYDSSYHELCDEMNAVFKVFLNGKTVDYLLCQFDEEATLPDFNVEDQFKEDNSQVRNMLTHFTSPDNTTSDTNEDELFSPLVIDV